MFKPMLAGSIRDLRLLKYPVLATPKLDGVRCLTTQDGPVSRKLKPIPNKYVREQVSQLGVGFDGELIIPGATDFGLTTSAFMRESGKPEGFEYHVFDVHDLSLGYLDRLAAMSKRLDFLIRESPNLGDWVQALIPKNIHNLEELLKYEEQCLADGYEGIMVRSINGPYKQGRSTEREGYLLKLKRFEDSEGKVIGFKEWQSNTNTLERDALGHAKRSSHKEGKVPKGSLGALTVEWNGLELDVGTGFTNEQRDNLWAKRDEVMGKIIKFKYQAAGMQEVPRFPVFLGFRHEDDM